MRWPLETSREHSFSFEVNSGRFYDTTLGTDPTSRSGVHEAASPSDDDRPRFEPKRGRSRVQARRRSGSEATRQEHAEGPGKTSRATSAALRCALARQDAYAAHRHQCPRPEVIDRPRSSGPAPPAHLDRRERGRPPGASSRCRGSSRPRRRSPPTPGGHRREVHRRPPAPGPRALPRTVSSVRAARAGRPSSSVPNAGLSRSGPVTPRRTGKRSSVSCAGRARHGPRAPTLWAVRSRPPRPRRPARHPHTPLNPPLVPGHARDPPAARDTTLRFFKRGAGEQGSSCPLLGCPVHHMG